MNTEGNGAASTAITVTPSDKPSAPTNLSATSGSGSVSIAFTPGLQGASAITNYEYSIDSGSWTAFATPVTTSPVTITGLTNGNSYSIRLRAVNTQGAGEASSPVSVTLGAVPSAPTSVTASPGNESAVISFTAGSAGSSPITNYEYRLNGGTWTALTPTKTAPPLKISGLTNGTSYTIDIRAVSDAGAGASTSISTTPNLPPVIDKVTICHRTSATTNPYVLITVSVNSVVTDGANGHQWHNTTKNEQRNPATNAGGGSGPFDPNYNYPPNRKWWGDIIPPFAYSASGVSNYFAGLNWGPDWATPDPTSSGASRASWLEDSEFADAVSGTNDIYRQAVALCIDLSAKTASTESVAVSSPTDYFNVMVKDGENPDDVYQDLDQQEALDEAALATNPSNPSPTRRTLPTQATLVTNFQTNVAKLQTNPATLVGQTTATLNGELKALSGGSNWTDWKYEWGTSESDVRGGLGSTYSTTTTGSGPTSPSHALTGLTCGTTYHFRVVGTWSTPSTTEFGLF